MQIPDFDEIARQLALTYADERNIEGLDALERVVLKTQALRVEIGEHLRQVWNARGAADGAALKAELQRALDAGHAGERPEIKLDQMIKALDR